MSNQLGQASVILSWWSDSRSAVLMGSTAPGALLHNSLSISQGPSAKVEVKSDSPPVSFNHPPSAHLFIYFIWLCSPSKALQRFVTSAALMGLIPEVTCLVLVFACWEIKCAFQQHTCLIAPAIVAWFGNCMSCIKVRHWNAEASGVWGGSVVGVINI